MKWGTCQPLVDLYLPSCPAHTGFLETVIIDVSFIGGGGGMLEEKPGDKFLNI